MTTNWRAFGHRAGSTTFERPRRAIAAHPGLLALEGRAVPATLLPNFSESVVVGGLSDATAFEFSPEGSIFAVEKAGTIEVWRDGTRLQANFFRDSPLPRYNASTDTGLVDANGERGLLGVTFDPNYSANRHVFVYYTYAVNADGNTATPTTFRNRVSRFTANAPGDLSLAGSERPILELNDLSTASNHNGGALRFGPDGKLYVAVGDNANGANSQSLANLKGKILRINGDGSIPADNPFYTTATGDNRAIWALGLRNPFTFAFQPGTGRLHINDVGQNTWEEINVGAAGANYGWPTTEGDFNQASYPSFTRPLYAYSHGSGTFQGYAITGGAFYNPSSPGPGAFPASYSGDYFFADYVNNWVNVLDTGTGAVGRFITGATGTVDLRVGADGSLYYLSRNPGVVARVTYTPSQAPAFTTQPADATVPAGGSATFTAEASGGSPLTYQWQREAAGSTTWVDIPGATGTSYTFAAAGAANNGDRFRAVATNPIGSATSNAARLAVTANRAPSATITINSGLTGGKFIAGQPIGVSLAATDPEDGPLAAGRLTYRVDYISSINSGNPAVRPFVPDASGQASASFTPATTGPYTLTDVAYRVVLTATDSGGLATTTSVDVAPNTATLTVTTSPAGLQVTVDGQPYTAPHTFESVVGFQRPIGAAATQTSGGSTYNFASWSDAGAATHTITTPTAATTYTATYTAAGTPTYFARVNFQDGTSAGFPGYVADKGAAFGGRGNGLSYGWNANNAPTARNRNSARSPDERYDTLQHLQKPENPNASWELAVPNGTYTVRLVAGDPDHIDSVYRLDVEGVRAIDRTPTTAARWAEGTVTVTVADGRLTLRNGAGSSNNKVNFIDVSAATPPGSARDLGLAASPRRGGLAVAPTFAVATPTGPEQVPQGPRTARARPTPLAPGSIRAAGRRLPVAIAQLLAGREEGDRG